MITVVGTHSTYSRHPTNTTPLATMSVTPAIPEPIPMAVASRSPYTTNTLFTTGAPLYLISGCNYVPVIAHAGR